MDKSLILLILLAAGFAIWIIAIIINKFFSKSGVKCYKILADKYELAIDLYHKEGIRHRRIKLPVANGTYRGYTVQLGAMLNDESGKKIPYTFISAQCENRDNLAFRISDRETAKPGLAVEQESPINDSEFDQKFIVNTNNEAGMSSLMNFNVKYMLTQSNDLGAKGELSLNGNEIRYTEPHYLSGDVGILKAEILLQLICDLADEIEKKQ